MNRTGIQKLNAITNSSIGRNQPGVVSIIEAEEEFMVDE